MIKTEQPSLLRKKRVIGAIFLGLFVFSVCSQVISAQSDYVHPGKDLLVEGVPNIPKGLAKAVNRYASIYGFPVAGWDPVKREVLLKGIGTTEAWISRLETPNGPPKVTTRIKAGSVYDLYPQPQGRYIVYNNDTEGNEAFQLYLYEIGTSKSTLLTDGKSRSVEPVWSNSGDKIIYGSTAPNGSGVDLRVINPFDPKSNSLLVPSGGRMLKAFDWSPDDRKVAFIEYLSNNSESLIWVVDVMNKEKSLLAPKTENKDASYYDSPQFSRDGRNIYIITDYASEFRRLARIELSTGQYQYLTDHIKWDVDEFRLAPNGKALAFVTNEDGISSLRLLDTETGKEKPTSGLPVGVISNIKWHNNSKDLAFDLESAGTPNDVYSLETKTGKIERWSKSETRGLDDQKFTKPEIIHWQSFDNLTISGLIYRPQATFLGKRPVIIDIHGGPDEQFRPRFLYEENYFPSEMGVVKIYPNVRGSAGYGKTFLRLDNGTQRMDAVKDIGALLDWIGKQPDLDAQRVMVAGASYGGYLALSVAATYGGRIRAVLSDSGPSNLATFLERTEGWRRDIKRAEYGDERDPKTREFMEQIAPLNNAQKITKPLMIVQGQNDPRVKAAESEQIVRAARKNGTPVWYILGKNEGHGFVQQNNREFQTLATVLFVKEYLLN